MSISPMVLCLELDFLLEAVAFPVGLDELHLKSMPGLEVEREIGSWCTATVPYLQNRDQILSRRKNKERMIGMMWILCPISWYRKLEESSRRVWRLHLGNVG